MIDIHHHCIPGVDDGPRDLDEAVALCRLALEDGIETIVATPHVLRGNWQNGSRTPLADKLDHLCKAVGDAPRLLLGSEYYFDYDMADVLASGEGIIPLANSHYVLVEFDAHAIPPLVDVPLYRAQLGGWTPVIAHPERNEVFQAKPELLAALVGRGAKAQVTAGSIAGDFGPEAQRASLQWIANGLVHFVASDAHNVKRRPPRMGAARSAVAAAAGDAVAEALFHRNAEAVIGDRQLVWDPEPSVEAAGGLLSRLRKFFQQ